MFIGFIIFISHFFIFDFYIPIMKIELGVDLKFMNQFLKLYVIIIITELHRLQGMNSLYYA